MMRRFSLDKLSASSSDPKMQNVTVKTRKVSQNKPHTSEGFGEVFLFLKGKKHMLVPETYD